MISYQRADKRFPTQPHKRQQVEIYEGLAAVGTDQGNLLKRRLLYYILAFLGYSCEQNERGNEWAIIIKLVWRGGSLCT